MVLCHLELCFIIGIGGCRLKAQRGGLLKIRIHHVHRALAILIINRVGHGMSLGQIEQDARLDEMGHDLGPALDFRWPVERASAYKHRVELFADQIRRIIKITLD
jgi:hypothetical protein